jgi:protoporphyrinogen IX oxidase
MMFLYLKAFHIVFVVTWFAALFYMPRLFIYTTEANDLPDAEKRKVLSDQFKIMQRRLWYGIAWPSCIATIVLGGSLFLLYPAVPLWLWIKLGMVVLLLLYHVANDRLFRQQARDQFVFSSKKLRVWNEMVAILLIAIVLLAVVKDGINYLWYFTGIGIFFVLLIVLILRLNSKNKK